MHQTNVSGVTRRAALGLLATAVLAACGKDETAPPSAPASSSAAPSGGGMTKLAEYSSAYRFPAVNDPKFDDSATAGTASLEMRDELVKFLVWAKTNGHPDVTPALPARIPAGQETMVNALLDNLDLLDTTPLTPTVKQPFGRVITDEHTVTDDLEGKMTAVTLTLIKAMLSKADYAKLIAESPLTKAAAGKRIIAIYPYTAPVAGSKLDRWSPPGVADAFIKDPGLHWMIANPSDMMSAADKSVLLKNGGKTYTESGFRQVHVDSARLGGSPVKIAQAVYEGLKSVSG